MCGADLGEFDVGVVDHYGRLAACKAAGLVHVRYVGCQAQMMWSSFSEQFTASAAREVCYRKVGKREGGWAK